MRTTLYSMYLKLNQDVREGSVGLSGWRRTPYLTTKRLQRWRYEVRNADEIRSYVGALDLCRDGGALLGVQYGMADAAREFVVGFAFEFSACGGLADSTPLFEEERHLASTTLIPDG